MDDPHTRQVVITGGGGTLGRAIAAAFDAAGCHVSAPGRCELDVRDPAAVARFFSKRTVDLLVCAAGITRDAPLARLGEAAWDETWDVNFSGAAACAAAALPAMIARGGGHIVFLSSHSALHPPPGQAAYAAAKAALLGLTTDLARRHGPANIRVNAVLPGFIESPMTAAVAEKRRAHVIADHALGRLNTAGHVAAFIRFLHLELPHTSGQVFQLDSRA
jgi:3-oxoacyl-[acyl-carrier protein] reductase